MRLTLEQSRELGDRLIGTAKSVYSVLESMGLEPDDFEDIEDSLLDVNVELCPDCDWWHESDDLVDCNGDPVSCEQCRPKQKD